jgi:hypothetical protein
MQKNKLKIKVTPKRIVFWFYFLIIIIIVTIIWFLSLFLYKNLYQVVTQSKEILILQEKVSIESINIKSFERIMENINNKINPNNTIKNFKNPFN